MMKKAERTRQFIIEKTAPVFNKKGFYGTSLSDITAVTGLTKGSIYGNFKNKDELAIEAFRHNYFLLAEEINKILRTRTSAIEKLLAFTEFYKHKYINVFERGGCAILNAGTDSDDNHDLLRHEVRTSLLNWKKLLESIISEGIKAGEIASQGTENFPGFFIALIEGSIFISKTTGKTDLLLRNIEWLEKEIYKLKK